MSENREKNDLEIKRGNKKIHLMFFLINGLVYGDGGGGGGYWCERGWVKL